MESILKKLLLLVVFLLNVTLSCVLAEEKDPAAIKLSSEDYLQIDIANLKCSQTSDCVLVAGVCGKEWRPINANYKEKVERIVFDRNSVVDCKLHNFLKPQFACSSGLCMTVPDSQNCMLRTFEGECVSTCNGIAKDGTCEHVCQKGYPCD